MILGISPGTRSCGFVLVREGAIKKWGVQSYKGAWSDGKLIGILYSLSQLIIRHRIKEVAVKIPDTMPRSIGYVQLIGALNVIFEQRGIKARYYTLSELRKLHTGNTEVNRKALFAHIANIYPELQPLYQKEVKAEKPYYDRVFEAVAAAHCRKKK